jgi:hypothetical protein
MYWGSAETGRLPNRPGSLNFNLRVEVGIRTQPLKIQMPTGEILTRWTVRVALALYILSLTLRACAAGRSTWVAVTRLAWTGGCMAFLLHIVCAFHAVAVGTGLAAGPPHRSIQAALPHTALTSGA